MEEPGPESRHRTQKLQAAKGTPPNRKSKHHPVKWPVTHSKEFTNLDEDLDEALQNTALFFSKGNQTRDSKPCAPSQ